MCAPAEAAAAGEQRSVAKLTQLVSNGGAKTNREMQRGGRQSALSDCLSSVLDGLQILIMMVWFNVALFKALKVLRIVPVVHSRHNHTGGGKLRGL